MTEVTIFVCTNYRIDKERPSCGARGGMALLYVLRQAVEGRDIAVEAACCFGRCPDGAVVRIAPGGRFFHRVTKHDVSAIVQEAERFAESLRNKNDRE